MTISPADYIRPHLKNPDMANEIIATLTAMLEDLDVQRRESDRIRYASHPELDQ